MSGHDTDMTRKSTHHLPYQPPFQWGRLLDFFERRAIEGVEKVQNQTYYRTVQLGDPSAGPVSGWLAVSQDTGRDRLQVTLSDSLLGVSTQALERLVRQFDLACDPDPITAVLQTMQAVRPDFFLAGTRLPGTFDAFEMCVRAILGQQITVAAARTLAGRLAAAFGQPIETPVGGLTTLFPDPQAVLALAEPIADQLGPLGVTGRRAQTIRTLAGLLADEAFDFYSDQDVSDKIKQLLAVRGIGPWTAHYLAMRLFHASDLFLETDVGIKNKLGIRSEKELRALAEAWRPWRSYAVINIWHAPLEEIT